MDAGADGAEIRAIVLAAEAEQHNGNRFGGYILTLLHTACTPLEVAGMQRSGLTMLVLIGRGDTIRSSIR